jgi:hypothetical protein
MISMSPHEEREQPCGMNLASTSVESIKISTENRVVEGTGDSCLLIMVSFSTGKT